MDNSPEKTSKATHTEVEAYAAMVHTGQALGYGVAIPYHIKRKSWWYVLFSVVGIAIHIWSAFLHIEDMK